MTRSIRQPLTLALFSLSLSACLVDRVKVADDQGDSSTNNSIVSMDASSDSSANGGEASASAGGEASASTGTEGGGASTTGTNHSSGDAQANGDAGELECAVPCDTIEASDCDTKTGQCVRCTYGDDCDHLKATPACNRDVGCVECVYEDNTAKCEGKTPHCSNDAVLPNTCVECNLASQCGDDAPLCIDHKCVSCTESPNEACKGRANKICEPISGACVQCVVDSVNSKLDQGCDETFVCDPATNTCTTRLKDSANICQPCVADSECKADHRCLEMNYAGTKLTPVESGGGFCMKRFATGCVEPIAAAKINRGSLSGAATEDYCGVNEAITSCDAILAFGKSCAAPDGPDPDSNPDADASLCEARGARCETVSGAANKCTYGCTDHLECPTTRPCGGAGGPYCGS